MAGDRCPPALPGLGFAAELVRAQAVPPVGEELTARGRLCQAVLVTPLSGPLARYGRDGAEALALWAEEAAALPPPWQGVKLALLDAHPDPAAAMRAARGAELIFGPYGSGPARQALAAAEGRLVWNHGGASSALVWPRYPGVVNVPAPAADYFSGALAALHQAEPGLRRLAMLHAATGFGREVAAGAQARAVELGLQVHVQPFTPGEAAILAERLPAAEEDVLLVAGAFEDELAAARVLLSRHWRAAGFVAAGVDEVLAPLGAAREGLLGPCQWLAEVLSTPNPQEGPDAAWFSRRYSARTGRPPSYPAAQAFAAGLLAARCAREAFAAGLPPDDAGLLAQARRLRCTTLYGAFALDPDSGRQRGHQLLTVQWQGGRRVAVWPPPLAQARLELRA